MGRRLLLAACSVLFLGLAALFSGCDEPDSVVTSQNCVVDYCDFLIQGRVRGFTSPSQSAIVRQLSAVNPSTGLVEDFRGIRFLCTCGGCGPTDSMTIEVGTVAIGNTVHYHIVCGDPVLAEWPNTWGLTTFLWGTTPAANSALITVLAASSLQVPKEFGPIVTDPGYSAHELDYGLLSMPDETVYKHFQFRHNGLRLGYVKGLDVGLLTILETNQRYIFPAPGGNLDLSALQPPDPRVLLLGPDAATPARKSSWGGLKLHYR